MSETMPPERQLDFWLGEWVVSWDEGGQGVNRIDKILDGYVIRRLLGPFAMVLLSTSLLYVVIDLTDNVDDMAKNNVSFNVIVAYYFNLVPQLIMDIMPLALMIRSSRTFNFGNTV